MDLELRVIENTWDCVDKQRWEICRGREDEDGRDCSYCSGYRDKRKNNGWMGFKVKSRQMTDLPSTEVACAEMIAITFDNQELVLLFGAWMGLIYNLCFHLDLFFT
ncbi:uncharacterized protein LAJ45_02709 [Morchella importuna]|uniref:uncharacterized protein n=1 Tax=Morchella importuna TaxID=1174673 RepID=UPI001E8E3065|nr:uncharacterized protein LAJ45_02709 [Morchella importuna]KAH8153122.1 hypothetical protein LAJ45_02709 [Morchella importuna]